MKLKFVGMIEASEKDSPMVRDFLNVLLDVVLGI